MQQHPNTVVDAVSNCDAGYNNTRTGQSSSAEQQSLRLYWPEPWEIIQSNLHFTVFTTWHTAWIVDLKRAESFLGTSLTDFSNALVRLGALLLRRN